MEAKLAQSLSPTREKILHLLKEWGKGTATQLSKALGISRIAVHQHLAWLKAHGLVSVSVERKGCGRPAEVFTLTEKAQEQFFPRHYDLLAVTVLDEVASEFGDEFVHKLFRRFRERWRERLRGSSKSLRQRVRDLANLLAEEGYLARWEETPKGFILSLSNCPIAQVAKRFQHACVSEVELLTDILGAPVVRQCHQVSGDACCRYFVAKPKGRSKSLREEVNQ